MGVMGCGLSVGRGKTELSCLALKHWELTGTRRAPHPTLPQLGSLVPSWPDPSGSREASESGATGVPGLGTSAVQGHFCALLLLSLESPSLAAPQLVR